jgi:GT2 family glycosyltransferase
MGKNQVTPGPSKKPLDLAIVIPCADDLRLTQCLDSIDEDVEIIVVLNGATDAIRQLVIERHVRYYELPKRNLGAACDVGVRVAKASSVLLMNSDCTFARGTIKCLAEALDHAMVARGRVVFGIRDPISRIIANARDYAHTRPDKAYQPPLAFRKEIIGLIGGYYFDPDIHWTEDADFSRRVKAAGVPIAFLPDAIVYHPALSLHEDLRSAVRYGIGRRIAEEKRLVGVHPPFRPYPRKIMKTFNDVAKEKGLAVALYVHGPWLFAFSVGYLAQKLFRIYNPSSPVVYQQL